MRTTFLAVVLAALAWVTLVPSGRLLAGVGLGSSLELTAGEKAKAALVQVRQAIAAGEAGDATDLRGYVRLALDLARSSTADPQMTDAARYLEQAMAAADEGDTSAGVAYATEAQRELQAAG